ncbi:hypothetical protein ABL78_5484 [Leptomonas seymouri]|uniref:Uncharacterized protein n=1 Tax=Leptomonas seymouri TaxID=5684 RepID=A0A0N1I252_LEPSE|nr:hypothetical protein ABL78_5484 [Leptomonas seymouri]|eukprot:KPI85463.1 hypothetical protein ABL78_5484 [Leptomonas seymouri]
MTEPSYASVLRALCRSITSTDAIRVKGKQEEYRCKATYSLLPKLQVSPLSMRSVNEIATAVSDFCATRSRISVVARDFFFEVCVKVSRDDRYMVKLSFLNQRLNGGNTDISQGHIGKPPLLRKDAVASALSVPLESPSSREGSCTETLFDVWMRSSEAYSLEDHLRAVHPGLAAVVAHVCLPSPEARDEDDSLHRKPNKSSAYIPLTRSGASAMVEYTPNGHPFWLSADSFCEVNHEMETAIYEAIVEFLRLSPKSVEREEDMRSSKDDGETVAVAKGGRSSLSRGVGGVLPVMPQSSAASLPSPPSNRRAFVCGRDVNSVVRTFSEYYCTTTVVTTCPRVYADTKMNSILHCVQCAKDQIAEPLRTFALAGGTSEDEGGRENSDPARSNRAAPLRGSTEFPAEAHCLITAGRHGLHPSTTAALMELGAAGLLSHLIYVSCNVESLTRDLHILKETWCVAHARTFDFFPGTNYVMTVLHLQTLSAGSAEGSCLGGGGDLLVLPVGLPGTGKSTCGRALEAFFRGMSYDAGSVHDTGKTHAVHATLPPETKKAKEVRCAGSPTASVPRTLLFLRQRTFRFRHVERDQIFQEKKSATSLRVAKQETHEALVAALGVWEIGANDHVHNDGDVSFGCCRITPRRVLYLDSTNGSCEARKLYQSLWRASSQLAHRGGSGGEGGKRCCGSASLRSSCVVLFFDTPGTVTELLRRVQQRGPHPSFPSAIEQQLRKLEVIASALKENENVAAVNVEVENDTEVDAADASCWHIHASSKDNAAKETIEEVVLTVCAHLLFSSGLVSLLRNDALRLLREGA